MTSSTSKLSDFAYFGTGGTADSIYSPESIEELSLVIIKLRAENTQHLLLGGGTNSLVSDQHFSGAAILFNKMDSLELRGNNILVGAGVENTELSQFAFRSGLVGAGWMNRLPGQMGGTVRMNARCYGGEISQVVVKVHAVMPDGEIAVFSDSEMFRGYKDTVFMDNNAIIARVEVALVTGDLKETEALMRHCENDRIEKKQFDYPTCGCVFKNDYSVGVSSGMLLDEAGVKDFEHNGAFINSKHANFVFNKSANSRSILELSFAMREAVFSKFGVWLEYEMELLGVFEPELLTLINEKRPHEFKEQALNTVRAKFKKQNN
jgi:UDP-N-acetylmuramate dehydrogenase